MTTHTAAFPSVIAAIVTAATSAVNPVRVTRGLDFSGDPGDVVMVGIQGIQDIDPGAGRNVAGSWAASGTFRQTMQTFGGGREEVGEVNGVVVASNGQSDQDAACSVAFGYLALIEAAVRADPTLGLSTTFDYVVAELQAGDVTESQNDAGVATALSFVITYKIRI